MKRLRAPGLLVLAFLVSLVGVMSSPVRAQTATPGVPVVHAIMFWKVGCHYCEQAISVILPPIQDEYGERFDLQKVRIITLQDADNLLSLAESMGMDPHVVGVPFLIVGDTILMGPSQIHEKLPGLIDEYLAQGGVDLPANPILAQILSAPTPTWTSNLPAATPAAPAAEAPASPVDFSGRDLATATLFWLCASLGYAVVAALWKRLPAPSSAWAWAAVLAAAACGLGVAGYLSYEDLRSAPVVCGLVGNCNVVQSSNYARLFGVLPVALLGVCAYLLIVVAWSLVRFVPRLREPARLGIFGLAFVGTVYSSFLTYLERFVLQAVCLWCIVSAILMSLILLGSISPARGTFQEQPREGCPDRQTR